jgi:hypothetical protein
MTTKKQGATAKKLKTKTKKFTRTTYTKFSSIVKPSNLPDQRPESAILVGSDKNDWLFDGSQIKFALTDNQDPTLEEISTHFTIHGATRDGKPCAHWKPFANLTIKATHKPTGQKIIMKIMSDNTTSVDPTTGKPRQCMIDERKEMAGLRKIGTHWCVMNGKFKINENYLTERIEDRETKTRDLENRLGRALNKNEKTKLNDDVRPRWATQEPLNFSIVPHPTRFIIMRDFGDCTTIQSEITRNKNFLNSLDPDVQWEVMLIVLFKIIYTHDNHFAQILISGDLSRVLSIDEEDLADDIVERKNRNKKFKNSKLSEYFEYLIKRAVKSSPGFFDVMKTKSSDIVDWLVKLLERELLITNGTVYQEKFSKVHQNIDAVIELFGSYCN